MQLTRRIGSCLLLASAALVAAAPAAAVKRRAFVTSVTGSGDLSSWPDAGAAVGLNAGDAICRARAAAAGLPNATAYRAWLSTPVSDAYCHVRGLSGQKGFCAGGSAAGPWYLANGITSFTGDLDELTGPGRVIYRPVMLDEYGDEVGQADGTLWTGTLPDGTAGAATCGGWTSTSEFALIGHALATADNWTFQGGTTCADPRRLLCVEPGASEPTNPSWTRGALVFATSAIGTGDLGSWPAAGAASGIAAGDAICRSLAAAAHLPAPTRFSAWLSTDAADAAGRVTTNGPFRRIDGFAVANNKAELVGGAIRNSLHQDENGDYLAGPVSPAWTGTQPSGLASGLDCGAWTQGESGWQGTLGQPNYARTGRWTDVLDVNCNLTARLYCIANVVTVFWDGFELTGDASRWSSVAP